MNFKITPLFTEKDIQKDFERQIKITHELMMREFSQVGMEWATAARMKTPSGGSFNDQTGSLRSSIGYILLYNGEIAKIEFEKTMSIDNETGKENKFSHNEYAKETTTRTTQKVSAELGMGAGIRYAKEVANDYPTGWALILVAGMEYASFVEAKGFDVIMGSTLSADKDIERAYKRIQRALSK